MKEEKILSGVYDCIFKALLLNKENKEFLKIIINEITDIPLKYLDNIQILNNEHIVENKKDKKMRSDIIVSIGNRIINIEMNKDYYEGVFRKNDGYLSKMATRLYNEGDNYLNTYDLIQINFDNFNFFKYNKEIYKFVYKEEEKNILLPGNSTKYHIDLAYIKKVCYNKPVVNLTKFERHCLILIAETKEELKKLAGDDSIMKKVSRNLINLSLNDKMIGIYDAEVEAKKVMKTQLLYAEKKGMERGLNKGIKKGIKQGLEQGLEQGIEKGIEKGSKNTKEKIVKSMYRENIDLTMISKITEVSIEDIKKIIK